MLGNMSLQMGRGVQIEDKERTDSYGVDEYFGRGQKAEAEIKNQNQNLLQLLTESVETDLGDYICNSQNVRFVGHICKKHILYTSINILRAITIAR